MQVRPLTYTNPLWMPKSDDELYTFFIMYPAKSMLVILIQSFNNEEINLLPTSSNQFSRPDLIIFANKTNKQKKIKNVLKILQTAFIESLNFRATEWLKGSAGCCLMEPPCSNRVIYSQLSKILYRQFLSISMDGEPTTSLNNLCQSLVILTLQKGFLLFR